MPTQTTATIAQPTVTQPSELSAKKAGGSNIFLYFVLTIVLLFSFGLFGFYFYKFYWMNPQPVLDEALAKFEGISSLSVKLDVSEAHLTIDGDLHKDLLSQFSRMDIGIVNIEDEIGHDLKLQFIANRKDLYLRINYTKAQEIDQQVQQLFPPITQLQFYSLVRPVAFGAKWIHAAIPQEFFEGLGAEEDSIAGEDKRDELSEENLKQLIETLKKSLILRDFDRSYEFEGRKFKHIVYGLKQEELLEFLDKLKDQDLEIDVADINAMVDFVKAVNNWNSDLIEILIDEDNYLYMLTLSLPELPDEVLKERLKNRLKEQSTIQSLLEEYLDKIQQKLEQKEQGKMIKIGTIRFTNYNSVSNVKPPADTEVVELEEIIQKAQEELLPLVGAMIGGTLGAPVDESQLPPGFQLPSTESGKEDLFGFTDREEFENVQGVQHERGELVRIHSLLEEIFAVLR